MTCIFFSFINLFSQDLVSFIVVENTILRDIFIANINKFTKSASTKRTVT